MEKKCPVNKWWWNNWITTRKIINLDPLPHTIQIWDVGFFTCDHLWKHSVFFNKINHSSLKKRQWYLFEVRAECRRRDTWTHHFLLVSDVRRCLAYLFLHTKQPHKWGPKTPSPWGSVLAAGTSPLGWSCSSLLGSLYCCRPTQWLLVGLAPQVLSGDSHFAWALMFLGLPETTGLTQLQQAGLHLLTPLDRFSREKSPQNLWSPKLRTSTVSLLLLSIG